MNNLYPAGDAHDLRFGEVRVIALAPDPRGRPREALVLRDRQGELRAYMNLCQHVPIPLDAGSRVFLDEGNQHLRCGTHGAIYRLHDGLCVGGPCMGRALDALRIRIEADGRLFLEVP